MLKLEVNDLKNKEKIEEQNEENEQEHKQDDEQLNTEDDCSGIFILFKIYKKVF